MPDLTDAHRDHARRALIVGGLPAADITPVRYAEVVHAVATAIALAEQRGPAGGRTDPTDAEETAYRQGLAAALEAALEAMDADPHADHAEGFTIIRDLATVYGITLPGSDADPGGLLETDEPQADEPLCAHPGGHPVDPDDGFRRCPSCGDVAVTPVPSSAADRLSWTGTEGLIITPPPADPS